MITTKKSYLPAKAVEEHEPTVYWTAMPTHKNFTDNDSRIKFCNTLESIVKTLADMWVIKIKEHWDFHDENLVVNNRMLSSGTAAYWRGIDSTFRFNVVKREEFLAKEKVRFLTVIKENKLLVHHLHL